MIRANGEIKCPDCQNQIASYSLKQHILMCKNYNKKLLTSTIRLAETLDADDLRFLMAQLQMARETILDKMGEKNNNQDNNQVNFGSYQSVGQAHYMNEQDQPAVKETNKNQKEAAEQTVKPTDIDTVIAARSKQEQKKMEYQEDMVKCQNCQRMMNSNDVNQFVYNYSCLHLLCVNCVKSYAHDQYVSKKGNLLCLAKGCTSQLASDQIKEILGTEEFDKLETQILRSTMQFVKCFKCKHQYQFAEGNAKDAPKNDEKGKKITASAAEHYAKNRFSCPSCKQQQCKLCHGTPYHLGRTCSENQEFKNAKKCRYCKNALKKGYTSNQGLKAFDDICEKKQCQKLSKKACAKTHWCKHPCLGYIRQKDCLPCLSPSCCKEKVRHEQDQDSYCSICYIEDLKASPCAMAKCGHIFHYNCLEKRLQIRWLTPRILFTFCTCPLCKQWLELPADCPLSNNLNKFKQLQEELKEKSLNRLKFEKLQKDIKITDSKSPFYQKPTDYAMAIYAYFQCFKCKKPFFGGRKSCAQVMSEEANVGSHQPYEAQKLICPSCCPVETKTCSKHGKQFIAFKCRFCCNIGLWFCWGSTHFCDDCHQKQLKGEYISKWPKEKLPKCEGKQKCPSGGDHGENGAQFSLGCMLCRNHKTEIHDF